jgi:hypothetical protein
MKWGVQSERKEGVWFFSKFWEERFETGKLSHSESSDPHIKL